MATILSSGGMDSFIAWALLAARGNTVVNTYVDIDSRYQEKELAALESIASAAPLFKYHVMRGPRMGWNEHTSGIIPLRNLALIVTAAQEHNVIYMGVLHGEINSDKSTEFFNAAKIALDISCYPQYWNESGTVFAISSPIRRHTKTSAVRAYLDSGYPAEWLQHTVSCYSQEDGHCGACASCFKRYVALINNKLPHQFNRDPFKWAADNGIFKKCRDGTYDQARADEIRAAVAARGNLLFS